LSYLSARNKAFSENEPNFGLGLAVDARTVKSVQSALGARVSTTINSSVGVFVPYASAQWIHEFKNDTPSIVSKYVADPFNPTSTFAIPTENPDRDYAILSLGSSATFPNNLSGFAQVSTAVGLRDITNYGFVLGLRKQF
jgi:outer membrane autotransporter protein